jgi:predicted CopG family antitoxin
MKNITITIDDEVYRAASEEAARLRKSLSELVQELLMRLRADQALSRGEAQAEPESPAATAAAEDEDFRKRREDLAQFFAGLKARRAAGQSEGEVRRAELLERLQTLVEEALERDRFKQGPLVPLTREEIYAERLDRFR